MVGRLPRGAAVKPLKFVLHTAVDVFELSNEFYLRFLERTGFTRSYLRLTFKLTDRLAAMLDVPGGMKWSDPPIDDLIQLGEESTRVAYTSMTLMLRELIDSRLT
jgi:hypothetical protein